MLFSTLLFDLDGTLIDTNHLVTVTFQQVLQESLGLDISSEEISQYFGEPLAVTMTRFSPERAAELTDTYRMYNVAQHDALIRQFDGICEALEMLHHAGVKIGVVTSKRTEMARRGLQICHLAPYIDILVGVEETEFHKPRPEPALLALDRLESVPGHHVLMVGDSRFDILCGRNAGLKTAAVGWTMQKREVLAAVGPDYWIEHPVDLTALVLGK